MIADLKPYPHYKESGLPWLGQVPGHWSVETLRRCLRAFDGIKIGPFGSQLKLAHMSASGFKVYGQANVIAGDIGRGSKYVDEAKFNELRECEVRPGDLLITMMGTSGRCMVVPEGAAPGLMDSHLLRLRLKTNGIGPIFAALTIDRATYVKQQVAMAGKGSIMHGLNSAIVKNLAVAIPLPAEQAAIVHFLDWANGRLERTIRAKRKVIALLNEQKQAIIHRAVTRGLDPSVPLKPSGIPWLGDIPQHWAVGRTKNVFRLRTQKSGLAHGKELLSIYTHIGVRPRKDLEQKGNKASTTDNYWVVRKGDLIVNKLLAWMGAVGSSDYEGVTSPAYDILMPVRPLCSDYYHHLFRTKLYLQQFKQRSRGIMDMRLRLYFDQLGQIRVPFPPVAEQTAIVAFYVEATADLTAAISRLEREIELLREYRTRLVADVVTGKLDVREAAARLREEAAADITEDDTDPSIDPEAADEEAAV